MAIAILNSPAEWIARFGEARKPTAVTSAISTACTSGTRKFCGE